MFGIPARTEFDLNFRLLGIPTRISPLFWIVAMFMGANLSSGVAFALWIVAVLVSIMVHEFGHALTARRFGEDPEVVLYELGGLCVYQPFRQTPWRRFVVLMMGPGAGFLFMGLILLAIFGLFRTNPADLWNLRGLVGRSGSLTLFLYFLFYINITWGLINLLPVFPLDGGQMALIVFNHFNRRNGTRWSFVVSLVCGASVAIYMATKENYMPAILFGLLAFRSYQILQTMHYQNRFGESFEDDSDWWKR
jgi:uncharacterized membrane protein (UPF0136 family)